MSFVKDVLLSCGPSQVVSVVGVASYGTRTLYHLTWMTYAIARRNLAMQDEQFFDHIEQKDYQFKAQDLTALQFQKNVHLQYEQVEYCWEWFLAHAAAIAPVFGWRLYSTARVWEYPKKGKHPERLEKIEEAIDQLQNNNV